MQHDKNNSWQRLEAVIQWAGMSVNYFARHIGLTRGETLYQIRRGNNGISKQVARRIVEHFPEINELWLLTGSGEMFLHENVESRIPFYRQDVEQVLQQLDQLEPEEYLYLPMIADADLAVAYRGEAMAPRIPAGAVLFLKSVPVNSIAPGNAYVLKLTERVLFRTVRVSDQIHWRLIAINHNQFDEFEILREEVLQAWRVVGHLALNNE